MIAVSEISVLAAASRAARCLGAGLGLLAALAGTASAQGVDCGRLQQQIATSGAGRGNAQRAGAELARAVATARQLGCDRQQFLFFGSSPPPQCGGLNARIAQLQAAVSQGQGGGRDDLVARFNAYCRGGSQNAALQPQRQRGFFESLFGGGEDPRQAAPADLPPGAPGEAADDGAGDGAEAHGGSQAICVRTCDGGFFPMNMSSRRGQDSLNEMCAALCPNTQTAVYTRNPNSEIKTAVSLDGHPYMDLPNALKFQKSYDSACTCRPANKTWAEALSGAETVLGSQRKGDILVTPEKSVELSRPKLDGKTRATLLNPAQASAVATSDAKAGDPKAAGGQSDDVTGPDGVTRRVRTVGPKL